MEDTIKYVIWAVILGGISAVSLPLGSLFGVKTHPHRHVISTLAAFGAGALLAALSIELVAPTMFALDAAEGVAQHGDPRHNLITLITGLAAGGLLYNFLNWRLNHRGGFLRRTSSTISYLTAQKRVRELATIEALSTFALLRNLQPTHVSTLVSMVRPVRFYPDESIATEGEPGKQLVFITKGTLVISTSEGLQSRFGAGSMVGVVPLVTGQPCPGTGMAETEVGGYALSKEDFNRLCEMSPAFSDAVRELAGERMELIAHLIAERDEEEVSWLKKSQRALSTHAKMPDELDWKKAREEHKSAPLAIWLGILLDGIPESFVIGSGLFIFLQGNLPQIDSLGFADVVPYTLIAGLFLSNFPEALASSANMQMQGFSNARVFLLWFSLLVMTALGAGVGFLLADSTSHSFVIFAEGLAAGAMLTTIAGAVIPEAVHMGRPAVVGLSTLGGFLAAITFKLVG